jgi:hypothetical protein
MSRANHPTHHLQVLAVLLLLVVVLVLSWDLQRVAGGAVPHETEPETKSKESIPPARTVVSLLFDTNNVPIQNSTLPIIHDGKDDPWDWMVHRPFDGGDNSTRRIEEQGRLRSLQISGSKTGMLCKSDMLRAGEYLHRKEAICATPYDAFGLDNDGNVVWLLVDYQSGGPVQTLWMAPSVIQGGADVLTMQDDGNLG